MERWHEMCCHCAATSWFVPAAAILIALFLFCFHVFFFCDAGDDAPSQKEMSHMLVRLLLRRDDKTIHMLTTSTHWKFSALKFLQKEARASFRPSETVHKHRGTIETRCSFPNRLNVTKLRGRIPPSPLSARRPATLPSHLWFPLTTNLSFTVIVRPR